MILPVICRGRREHKHVTLDTVLERCIVIVKHTSSITDIQQSYKLRVFEDRILRSIRGPKREKVAGKLRRLHDEELRNFYFASNIIRVIKSGRMKWVGHVAHMV
jgi:hypothetical protein